MDLTDTEIFALLAQKDERALAILYDRYAIPAYSVAYKVLNNKEAAEEVIQDVFLSVWKNPTRWDPNKGRLPSWLLTVTRNRAIDRLRRELRILETTDTTPLDETPSLTVHRDLINDPLWADGQLLRQLLQQIPVEQARVIELAFFKGMSHSAIAEATRIPLGTVKARLRYGLQKLRQLWFQETEQLSESGQDET